MKDSGIEWIGEIPEEWEIDKCNRVFQIIGSGTTPRGEDIFENGTENWLQSGDVKEGLITTCKNKLKKQVLQDFNALKKYKSPFIIIAMYGASVGNIAISQIDACVNQACCVLGSPKSNFKFLYYALLSTKDFLIKKALGGGQPNISQEIIRQLWLPNPSGIIQQKIADFLDDKCAKIDSLIAHEEATIEELKAYKQSVITEAVTKGLDKSVPMKASGVEWIGEIPESWEIKKAKFLADMFSKGSGITKEDIVPDGDSPCVRYGEIYTKYDTYFKSCVTRTNLSNVSLPQYFSYGDILFVCTGELVEEIGKNIVYLGNERCLAGGDIIVMKHSHNPLYLSFALNSHISQYQKSCNKAKLKVVHISLGDIGNVLVAVPPLKEQKQIAEYLDKKCACIDSLVSSKQNKIEELKEYKKSLIYEYVTGKKEVA